MAIQASARAQFGILKLTGDALIIRRLLQVKNHSGVTVVIPEFKTHKDDVLYFQGSGWLLENEKGYVGLFDDGVINEIEIIGEL
jgi:hypothetical protein